MASTKLTEVIRGFHRQDALSHLTTYIRQAQPSIQEGHHHHRVERNTTSHSPQEQTVFLLRALKAARRANLADNEGLHEIFHDATMNVVLSVPETDLPLRVPESLRSHSTFLAESAVAFYYQLEK